MTASLPEGGFSVRNADGSLKTADEIERRTQQMIAQVQKQAEESSAAIFAVEGEGRSRNQAATVFVGPTAGLKRIRLNDRVRAMTPQQIAESIMEAYARASQDAADAVQSVASQRPQGDAILDVIKRLLPAEDEERR